MAERPREAAGMMKNSAGGRDQVAIKGETPMPSRCRETSCRLPIYLQLSRGISTLAVSNGKVSIPVANRHRDPSLDHPAQMNIKVKSRRD